VRQPKPLLIEQVQQHIPTIVIEIPAINDHWRPIKCCKLQQP
jgi:hypothetical protein